MMIKHTVYIFIFLLSAASCTSPVPQKQLDRKPYFDLATYFQTQAAKLQQQQPMVNKEVSKNQQTEKQRLKIDDWTNELALFSLSDINKSDWLNSYLVDTSAKALYYQAKDSTLRTKQLIIQKNTDGSVKQIHIENSVHNWLYQSTEKLDYFPQSGYHIYKKQHVRIIGTNEYTIEGKW